MDTDHALLNQQIFTNWRERRSELRRMSQQGAALQGYNNELIKCKWILVRSLSSLSHRETGGAL